MKARTAMALCAALWMQWTSGAPALYSASAVKAVFLYRFAGYVEWPAATMESPRFVIAVLGADEVAAKLEMALDTLDIKGRPVEVRRIEDIADARQAHIVYIGSSHGAPLGELLAQVAARPVLTVTDDVRGLDAGSMLNFRVDGQRVRFEVSPDTAEQAGLTISADLLAVAMRVRRRDLRSDERCVPPLGGPVDDCVQGLLARQPSRVLVSCGSRQLICLPQAPIPIRTGMPWTPPA